MSEYDHTLNPISPTGHEWPCLGFYRTSSIKDRTDRCTCTAPSVARVREALAFNRAMNPASFDRWMKQRDAEIERAAAARALEEAAEIYGPAQISGFFVRQDGYAKAWLRARAAKIRENS